MKYAVVSKSIGVLKSEPYETAMSIDEVLFGMNIEILRQVSNNWFYVKTHYNYNGYINKKNIIIDDTISIRWENEKNAVVTKSFADVLNKPEASGYTMLNLTQGAHLVSLGEMSENQNFIKVKLPRSKIGWVRKSFISDLKNSYDKSDEQNLRENLVKSALSYIGTQYRWGGKSPFGIDCSGLCSMAYMLNGIIIYRDAEIKYGFPIREITYDKLKKSDLIFFPGHVAMYLGDGNYIHSSTHNDVVKINSFNSAKENYNEYLDKSSKRFGSIF